jgi:predicted flap endonuclease-1-like 5' DNA nuclease
MLSMMIIAFMIGFLGAWWVNMSKMKASDLALAQKSAMLEAAGTERQKLNEALDLLKADLNRLQFELDATNAGHRQLESERQQLENNLAYAQHQLDKAHTAVTQYLATIEDLNDQIIGLKTRNAQLTAPQGAQDTSFSGSEKTTAVSQTLIGTFTESRLSEIEQRLRQLELSRDQHRFPKTEAPAAPRSLDPLPLPPLYDGEEQEAAEILFEPVRFVVDPMPGSSSRSALIADDLTRINGIGPFLQKKLNDIGIFTFQEIADWDAERIETVTRQIEFFDGRILKDDWVGQANHLMQLQPEQSQVADATQHSTDDLKLIEGIGPAIEEILHRAGIRTFENLAKSDPLELETIIQITAPQLHFVRADTWPAQARLAMNGEWEVLRDYQDQLYKGRPNRDEE